MGPTGAPRDRKGHRVRHGFGLLRRGALLGVLACLAAIGLAIPTTAAAKVTSLTRILVCARVRRVLLLAGLVFAAWPTGSALATTTVGQTGTPMGFPLSLIHI